MKRRWMILMLSFSIAFSYLFLLQAYPPIIPQVMDEFGLSYTKASLPMSLATLMAIFLILPTWALIFKWGLKRIGMLGLIICSIGGIISSIGSSFPEVIFGRIIFGIGGPLIVIVSFSMIPYWFPQEERGRAMGIKGLDMPIATLLAFNLLPILIPIHGWEIAFRIPTFILIISTVSFILLFRGKSLDKSGNKIFEGIWNRQIWFLGMIWGLIGLSNIAYSTWAGTFFVQLWKIPPRLAFFMASILMFAAIPLSPLIGSLSDKIGKRRVFIISSSFLMGISLILIPILPDSLLYLAIALLALSSFSAPIIFALVPEILTEKRAGLGFGILFVCHYVGIFLGPLLVGLVEDLFPGGTFAFSMMGFFSFLALICTSFLKTR